MSGCAQVFNVGFNAWVNVGFNDDRAWRELFVLPQAILHSACPGGMWGKECIAQSGALREAQGQRLVRGRERPDHHRRRHRPAPPSSAAKAFAAALAPPLGLAPLSRRRQAASNNSGRSTYCYWVSRSRAWRANTPCRADPPHRWRPSNCGARSVPSQKVDCGARGSSTDERHVVGLGRRGLPAPRCGHQSDGTTADPRHRPPLDHGCGGQAHIGQRCRVPTLGAASCFGRCSIQQGRRLPRSRVRLPVEHWPKSDQQISMSHP